MLYRLVVTTMFAILFANLLSGPPSWFFLGIASLSCLVFLVMFVINMFKKLGGKNG